MKLIEARAIVTGAARGLGRHFALRLARAGARVVAGDVNTAGLRALRAEAAAESLLSLSVGTVDISEEGSVAAFVEAAARELGTVNVLVNNAGVLRDGVLVAKDASGIRRLPLLQWEKLIGVNLTGQFLMAREVAARMIEQGIGAGVIINLSSLARTGNAGQSGYAATKAGLDACTRSWALELGPHGIRVASVAPGVIGTEILDGVSGEALDALLAAIPLGRFGTPEEVWSAVRFAIECDFFTGRILEVDGGAPAP
jgi:3-oxoacyl-[acyl-carrier protein] reductase